MIPDEMKQHTEGLRLHHVREGEDWGVQKRTVGVVLKKTVGYLLSL